MRTLSLDALPLCTARPQPTRTRCDAKPFRKLQEMHQHACKQSPRSIELLLQDDEPDGDQLVTDPFLLPSDLIAQNPRDGSHPLP